MDLAPNTILAHKYKLVRRLGEGGMGCVWVADHLHLDRQVAIKVISNRVISEPTVRDRFEIEARATAKVESPHVVQVLDFDYTESGQPFLVLELLVGETLEQRLSREGVLSVSDARELMKQTTHALHEAHRAQILHRDIKADNLFLVARDDLFVKLLDFGIAVRRDQPSIPDSALSIAELSPIGTPLYMSPEQTLALGPVDERSDLYSLAICLYYALTGEFPFCADSLAVLAFAQQREDFTMPSIRRPDLGPAIDAFFVRALAFHPEDRFSSADKMYEGFSKACDRRGNVHSDATTFRPGAIPSLAASMMRTEMHPRRKHSRGRSMLLVAAAAAAIGFFVIPREWLPSTPPAVASAAAFIANRIPTSQVSAATEPGPPFAIARDAEGTRASLLTLPLPLPLALPANAPAAKIAATAAPAIINPKASHPKPAATEETVEHEAPAVAAANDGLNVNVTATVGAAPETPTTSATSTTSTTSATSTTAATSEATPTLNPN